METRQNEPSLGQLFSNLTSEVSTLVRQEIALAKLELGQKVNVIVWQAIWLTLGAVMLFAAFLALMATAIIAIAYALPWWLSALIVTVIVGGIGTWLVIKGIDKLKNTSMAPQQTIESIKEDQTWLKHQTT